MHLGVRRCKDTCVNCLPPMGVRLLLFGLMGPFAAAFINRYGVRNVTLTAVAATGNTQTGS